MLTDKEDDGSYKIPFIIYSDAYSSETVAYADLVLPDTTYLERHDCISLLDRPIGDADGPGDAIRQPVVEPDRDVRPFQSVLLDLGARLEAARHGRRGRRAEISRLCRLHRAPRAHAGHRAARRLARRRRRRVRPRCAEPRSARALHRERRLLASRAAAGPALLQDGQPRLSRVRARQWDSCRPPSRSSSSSIPSRCSASASPGAVMARCCRPRPSARGSTTYFDPLPIWYAPLEEATVDRTSFPLHAITQRPMHMYHSWGSQNAWLRQITSQNRLFVHRDTAARLGLADDDWVWIESPHGRVKGQIRLVDGVNPDTVWTWNAIGKRRGAWTLEDDAPEAENAASCSTMPSANSCRRTRSGRRRFELRSDHRPGGLVRSARARDANAPPAEAGATAPQFPPLPRRRRHRRRARRRSASARSSAAAREVRR